MRDLSQNASHPEDLCSLAGWRQRRQEGERETGSEEKPVRERKRRKKYREQTRGGGGRDSEGGLGLIVSLLSHLHVASKGAPAASANFRLAQTCELLGAN